MYFFSLICHFLHKFLLQPALSKCLWVLNMVIGELPYMQWFILWLYDWKCWVQWTFSLPVKACFILLKGQLDWDLWTSKQQIVAVFAADLTNLWFHYLFSQCFAELQASLLHLHLHILHTKQKKFTMNSHGEYKRFYMSI